VAGGGMGYLRAAEVLAEVRSGDVVLIPYGYHGPAMAVPGYDMYYLNVMAGPGRREWLICDDPAHAWIRQEWKEQSVDPRIARG
jgi:5-deoxy-glucuronate isomerase